MGAFVFQDPPSFPALPFVCFSVSSVSKPPLSQVYEAALTVSAVPCAAGGARSCPSRRGQGPHRELGSGEPARAPAAPAGPLHCTQRSVPRSGPVPTAAPGSDGPGGDCPSRVMPGCHGEAPAGCEVSKA